MDTVLPLRRLRARRELAAARRAADAELIGARLPSPRLAWRTNELVGDGHRLRLAASIADVVHDSESRYLPGASPLNRGAARTEVAALLGLGSRLADTQRPVRPRGVLLVERLLTDSRSPLYARERSAKLRAAIEEAAAALEDTR